jgi:hypothetical protein
MPELPEDDWHTYVFVCLACYCECNAEADLQWACDDLPADGTPDAAILFTIRAVEYLKREGWQMIDNQPYCPICAAKRARRQTGTLA